MLASHARRWLTLALDLVLPRACVVCERLLDAGDSGPACARCWIRCVAIPAPRCDRCGHSIGTHSCRWCELLPPYVRAARSAYWLHRGPAAQLVHALKYGGWTALAEPMGERISRLTWPRDVIEERAAVVAVPLAAVRERERGYNQSALLASAVGRVWRLPVWNDVLMRTRPTRTQTQLTPDERRRNVAGAFRAPAAARARLRGKHLVLVDDVVTTGATFAACAAALLDGGARVISIATFGRAPAAGDPQ